MNTQEIKVTNAQTISINAKMQDKVVTPLLEQQIVLPDENYNALSKVVVEAIPNQYVIPNLQEKEARVTAPTNIFVHPDEEYDGLSFVNVIASVDTETKEVTPTKEVQNISRSDGKYIDSVTVNAIPDNYIEPSGEMEITENGSYDVTDKASVKVETSGADLSEYFYEETTGETSSYSNRPINNIIKRLPKVKFTGTTAQYGFYYLKKLIEVESIDLSEIQNCSYMFAQCESLKTIPQIDTSSVTSMANMFSGCYSLETIPLFDTSNVTTMSSMFVGCENLLNIPQIDTTNVTVMNNIFNKCKKITTIPLLNTSNVTNMAGMFNACENLETIPLLNTSNVTNMAGMFSECKKLKTIPLFDTTNVTNMQNMFSNCYDLETIPPINTSNVTNMNSMFGINAASKKFISLPELDASKVTSMGGFFSNGYTYSNFLDFGGLKNLGKAYTQKSANYSQYTFSLKTVPNLTHDSLMNVINNLYDLNLTYDVANGGTLYTQKLEIGATNLAKLTDEEKAIVTSKGWSLS